MRINKYCLGILFSMLLFSASIKAQVELVPVSHSVYGFLDRMLTNKVIDSYSSSMKPVSRREIAKSLLK